MFLFDMYVRNTFTETQMEKAHTRFKTASTSKKER